MQVGRTLMLDQYRIHANEKPATIGRVHMMNLSTRNAYGEWRIRVAWARRCYSWISRTRRCYTGIARTWRCYTWIARTGRCGTPNQMGQIAGGNFAIEQRSRRACALRTNAHHALDKIGTIVWIGQIDRSDGGALGTINRARFAAVLFASIEVVARRAVVGVRLTVNAQNVMITRQRIGYEDVAELGSTNAGEPLECTHIDQHQQHGADEEQSSFCTREFKKIKFIT